VSRELGELRKLGKLGEKRRQGRHSQFPILNSQFSIPHSQFPIPDSQFPNNK